MSNKRLNFVSLEHTLTLVPLDDGLKHRPRPAWAIGYMTCELNDAEVWLKSALNEESGKEVTWAYMHSKVMCIM